MLDITMVSPIQLKGETSHLLQTGNETNHTAQGDMPRVQVEILYLNVRLDGVVQLLLMALGHNVGQNPGKKNCSVAFLEKAGKYHLVGHWSFS